MTSSTTAADAGNSEHSRNPSLFGLGQNQDRYEKYVINADADSNVQSTNVISDTEFADHKRNLLRKLEGIRKQKIIRLIINSNKHNHNHSHHDRNTNTNTNRHRHSIHNACDIIKYTYTEKEIHMGYELALEIKNSIFANITEWECVTNLQKTLTTMANLHGNNSLICALNLEIEIECHAFTSIPVTPFFGSLATFAYEQVKQCKSVLEIYDWVEIAKLMISFHGNIPILHDEQHHCRHTPHHNHRGRPSSNSEDESKNEMATDVEADDREQDDCMYTHNAYHTHPHRKRELLRLNIKHSMNGNTKSVIVCEWNFYMQSNLCNLFEYCFMHEIKPFGIYISRQSLTLTNTNTNPNGSRNEFNHNTAQHQHRLRIDKSKIENDILMICILRYQMECFNSHIHEICVKLNFFQDIKITDRDSSTDANHNHNHNHHSHTHNKSNHTNHHKIIPQQNKKTDPDNEEDCFSDYFSEDEEEMQRAILNSHANNNNHNNNHNPHKSSKQYNHSHTRRHGHHLLMSFDIVHLIMDYCYHYHEINQLFLYFDQQLGWNPSKLMKFHRNSHTKKDVKSYALSIMLEILQRSKQFSTMLNAFQKLLSFIESHEINENNTGLLVNNILKYHEIPKSRLYLQLIESNHYSLVKKLLNYGVQMDKDWEGFDSLAFGRLMWAIVDDHHLQHGHAHGHHGYHGYGSHKSNPAHKTNDPNHHQNHHNHQNHQNHPQSSRSSLPSHSSQSHSQLKHGGSGAKQKQSRNGRHHRNGQRNGNSHHVFSMDRKASDSQKKLKLYELSSYFIRYNDPCALYGIVNFCNNYRENHQFTIINLLHSRDITRNTYIVKKLLQRGLRPFATLLLNPLTVYHNISTFDDQTHFAKFDKSSYYSYILLYVIYYEFKKIKREMIQLLFYVLNTNFVFNQNHNHNRADASMTTTKHNRNDNGNGNANANDFSSSQILAQSQTQSALLSAHTQAQTQTQTAAQMHSQFIHSPQALFSVDLCQILISYLYIDEQEIDCFLSWLVRLPQLCMDINALNMRRHKKSWSKSKSSKSATISYSQSIHSYNISSMISSDNSQFSHSHRIPHIEPRMHALNNNKNGAILNTLHTLGGGVNMNMIPMQYALEYAIMDKFVRDENWKYRQRIHKYFDNRKWIFRILMNQNFMHYAMKYDKEWLMIALTKLIKFVSDTGNEMKNSNGSASSSSAHESLKEHSYSNKMSVSDVINFTRTNFMTVDNTTIIV